MEAAPDSRPKHNGAKKSSVCCIYGWGDRLSIQVHTPAAKLGLLLIIIPASLAICYSRHEQHFVFTTRDAIGSSIFMWHLQCVAK